jgi:hypothetical protein
MATLVKNVCHEMDISLCKNEITCQILNMVKQRPNGNHMNKSQLHGCLKKLTQLKNSQVSDDTLWELVNWIYSKTQDSSLTIFVWETAMPNIREQLWRLFE